MEKSLTSWRYWKKNTIYRASLSDGFIVPGRTSILAVKFIKPNTISIAFINNSINLIDIVLSLSQRICMTNQHITNSCWFVYIHLIEISCHKIHSKYQRLYQSIYVTKIKVTYYKRIGTLQAPVTIVWNCVAIETNFIPLK